MTLEALAMLWLLQFVIFFWWLWFIYRQDKKVLWKDKPLTEFYEEVKK